MDLPRLLSVDDAERLALDEVIDLFHSHQNPGLVRYFRLLGFDRVLLERAEGMYYVDRGGRRILDICGVFGAMAVGHNHPRLLAVRRRFQEERRPEMCFAFLSPYAAALSRNLAAVAPGDLEYVHLCCTGSEAVEVALKMAAQCLGPDRATVAYASGAFHGKTRGALTVSDVPRYRSRFELLRGAVRVPFGDAAALAEAFRRDRSLGIVLLEPIQGGAGVRVPPVGYLGAVSDLCRQNGALLVLDEVQCGMGRTGRFFAFEHEGIVPDAVALAKSLGGGKTAMGAVIARGPVFRKAFGAPRHALIQGPTTFSGMGEACATAIETLKVIEEEGLVARAAREGAHLLERLEALRWRHPGLVRDVRGRGLMAGVTFDSRLAGPRGCLATMVATLLLRDHDVLVALTPQDPRVLRFEPPLIVQREEIDRLFAALDEVLSRGLARIAADWARNRRGRQPVQR